MMADDPKRLAVVHGGSQESCARPQLISLGYPASAVCAVTEDRIVRFLSHRLPSFCRHRVKGDTGSSGKAARIFSQGDQALRPVPVDILHPLSLTATPPR